MKVLILGKHPPVQGGVATLVYETATKLAEHHDVFVITAARFHRHAYSLSQNDLNEIHQSYRVLNFEESRELSLFREYCRHVAANFLPDVIVGWYAFPYGVVAVDLAKELSALSKIVHAGSDLFSLTKKANIGKEVRSAFAKANFVLSGGPDFVQNRLEEIGVRRGAIRKVSTGTINQRFYNENGTENNVHMAAADLNSMLGTKRADFSNKISKIAENGLPIIGYVGKPEKLKGFDSLIAASVSIYRKHPHNLLLLSGDDTIEVGMGSGPEHVFGLPFIHPILIPKFMSICSAVFCLEHNFSIKAHSPVVPREALASGTLLVCSDQIRTKQHFSDGLVDKTTCVVVEDPDNIGEVESAIAWVLEDSARATEVSYRGRWMLKSYERIGKTMQVPPSIESEIIRTK